MNTDKSINNDDQDHINTRKSSVVNQVQIGAGIREILFIPAEYLAYQLPLQPG